MKVKTWLFVSWQYPKYKNGILVSFGRSCKIDISLSVYQIMKIKSFYKMVSRRGKGLVNGTGARGEGRRREKDGWNTCSLCTSSSQHIHRCWTRVHISSDADAIWSFLIPPLSSNLLSYVESNICGVGFLACGFMVWMVIGRCAHVDTVGARALVKAQIWLFSGQMKLTILIKQH